jgi:DNA topoisomerase-1
MRLVIVESPSKCNTIQKYLGEDYKVIATCGHFRSLNKLEQIDFTNFSVKYETDKPKIIKLLKEESQKAEEIIIATDDDREGEAIGWHICQVCKLSLDTTKRIIFHEITEIGIRHAIDNPTYLNVNRVYSQNTRQILDLYIGFKVSPILWKYVQHKLSAGRCQTPALHLIYEQEMKISSQSYDDTHMVVKGYFTKNSIEFNLEKTLTKNEIIPFLTSLHSHEWKLNSPITKEQTISPPKIFTTSSLQQFSNNVLHMSPQQTMRSAQILYEKGLITYMRTDAAIYSNEFISKMKEHLGNDFSQPCMDREKDKAAGGNQAHEGIRITNLTIQDISINDSYTEKLYKYIYKHTLQTCMKPAVMFHRIYSTKCPNDLYFQYTDSSLKIPGWKKLDHEKNNVTSYSNYLDYLNEISLLKVLSTERCINPSFHWTESQLVNQLEKRDIGRPSTYTSILESILTKKYVSLGKIVGQELKLKKYEYTPTNQEIKESEEVKLIEESHKLSLTKLGKEVDEFCYKHFSDLFNYDYTTRMEKQLDMIEKGDANWKETLQEFISHVNSYLTIKDEMPKQYNSLHAGIYKKYPVVIKDGPHGYYVEYKKECHSLEYFENRNMVHMWIEKGEISSNELDTLIKYIENKTNPNIIVEINQNWSLRTGKYGKYLYYKTSKMKSPKFYNITIDTENKNELEEYIIKKYKNI